MRASNAREDIPSVGTGVRVDALMSRPGRQLGHALQKTWINGKRSCASGTIANWDFVVNTVDEETIENQNEENEDLIRYQKGK